MVLREMTSDDAEFYLHHFNKEKIVEGCCFPGPQTLEAAKEELERYCIAPFNNDMGIHWGITRKGDNKLIGTCGYTDWDKTAHKGEIGYDLDPAYGGQGIMTEALRAILEYVFRKMG